MSDTYSIIALAGLSGADREKLLLQAIAEQAARLRTLEKELVAERRLNKRLKRRKACNAKLLDEFAGGVEAGAGFTWRQRIVKRRGSIWMRRSGRQWSSGRAQGRQFVG